MATSAAVVSKLSCGLCGFVNPHSQLRGGSVSIWSAYYRAVYCIGTDTSHPLLSGLGYHNQGSADNLLPPRSYQRFDDPDLDPSTFIQIRDIRPPKPEPHSNQSQNEKFSSLQQDAWGFTFHDSCWRLLEQAMKPDPVDISALWRVLNSVPCASELPNWGHNYGGLYIGQARDQARGEHFVLMGPNSAVVIPSAMYDPFRVYELESLVQGFRIYVAAGAENSSASIIRGSSTIQNYRDPFAQLPLELRELLLCYLPSSDACHLRLASREYAATPFTQQFFRSRFWPDRELNAFFDAFLFGDRGTDWIRLYDELSTRLKYNMLGLGERNRIRIWRLTVKPLADALRQIAGMGELKGGPDWKFSNVERDDVITDFKIIRPLRPETPESEFFQSLNRLAYRAEVEVPDRGLKGVYVSLIQFFSVRYVTGLRFSLETTTDVEIGYIMRGSEEFLSVSGSLKGFTAALDECGFRALALITGPDMGSEYLQWKGDCSPTLPMATIRLSVETETMRVRAVFDGFRMQALLISGS